MIWVGVTAFGADGPYAGRPGIDFLAQGYAGLIAGNGDPRAPAVRVTAPLVDVMTSMCVATGVLAALRVRSATGQGQRIDISLLDVLTHAQATVLQSYLLAGEVVPRTGNQSHFFAPSGVWACADGRSLCLTCPSEKFFRNLCRALDVAWAEDQRFARTGDRLRNQEALDALIAARCRDFPRDALLERLIAADVLAAPVSEIPDVVRDPQIRYNDMIVETEHATLGPLAVTGVPIKLRGTPGSVRLAPPVQGQHTEELLVELGYAAGEIARLVNDGSVRRAVGRESIAAPPCGRGPLAAHLPGFQSSASRRRICGLLADLPEARLALLHEGGAPLAAFRLVEPVRVHAAGDHAHLGVAVHHLVEAGLQDLEAAGGEAEHFLAEAIDGHLELVAWHHFVHEPHREGLLCLVTPAEHPHLAGLLGADHVREVGHEEAVGRARDLRSRLAEDGVARRRS